MGAIHTCKKDEEKQMREFFSSLLILVQDRRWPEPLPAAQGRGQDPPWTGHPSIIGSLTPHTHSHWDHVDMPVHLTCTSLGHGRKLQFLWKEIHTNMGRIHKHHRDSGPGQESIFPPSSTLKQNDVIWRSAYLISQKLTRWWVFSYDCYKERFHNHLPNNVCKSYKFCQIFANGRWGFFLLFESLSSNFWSYDFEYSLSNWISLSNYDFCPLNPSQLPYVSHDLKVSSEF